MEFELKTACSLIKVLDGDQQTINSIIDCIEMYSEMLTPAGQMLLIKFILKSRLTQNAKLRMSTDYLSIHDLIKDLKSNLIPKKSPIAIQSRLQNISQGHRTIEQYGTEIEKLFSDLTITQADGNTQNYAVLKPINEKLAIKRFSDGLRNSRLSTIIAARNYEHLKDAIQAAKDEELSTASSSRGENDVMQFSHRPHRGRGMAFNYHSRRPRPPPNSMGTSFIRPPRYGYPNLNSNNSRHYTQNDRYFYGNNNFSYNNRGKPLPRYPNRYSQNASISRGTRGNYNRHANSRGSDKERVYFADQTQVSNDLQPVQSTNNMQFFRS